MATVSLGGTLAEKIEAIAGAGFDGIELLDADLYESGMPPAECAVRCADFGLSIDLYQPFRRAEGLSASEFESASQRFCRELNTMAQLGVDAILVVSNTDGDADASRDVSVSQVAKLADLAADFGVTLMFEALAWGTHINRVADAWDVVVKGERANLALVIDTFHLIAIGEDDQVLTEIPGPGIGLLQVADAPWRDMDLKQWSRGHRCFPGEGDMDILSPLKAILAGGYQGPISLEIFNPKYRMEPPAEVARRGYASLQQMQIAIEAVGIAPATNGSRDINGVLGATNSGAEVRHG